MVNTYASAEPSTRAVTSPRLRGLTIVILVLLARNFYSGWRLIFLSLFPPIIQEPIPPNTSQAFFKA